MKKYLKLKVFNLYGGAALSTDDDDDKGPFKCPICFQKYDATNNIPTTLSCGHSLCIKCMRDMQRRGLTKCPKCRADFASMYTGQIAFTLRDGSLYLKKKEKEIIKLKEAAEKLQKRVNFLELEKEKPSVKTDNLKFIANDKIVTSVSDKEKQRVFQQNIFDKIYGKDD